MAVVRQHADTDVHELLGRICEQLVVSADGGEIESFYALLDGTWHRFLVRDGMLVWHEGGRPDTEGDVDAEDSYNDLAAELNLLGASFTTIGFHAGQLELAFSNGARLVCTQGTRGAKVIEKIRGKIGVR